MRQTLRQLRVRPSVRLSLRLHLGPPCFPALLLPARHLTSGRCVSPSLLNQPRSLSVNLAFIPTHTHTYTHTYPHRPGPVSVCRHGCELRLSGLGPHGCANVLLCGSARCVCVCGGLLASETFIGLTDSGGRGLLLPHRTKRATGGKLRGKPQRRVKMGKYLLTVVFGLLTLGKKRFCASLLIAN